MTQQTQQTAAWSLCRNTRGETIVVFSGRIDAKSGQQSVAALLPEFEAGCVELIFDVRTCTGYASEARMAWQEALMPRRNQIRRIVVISSSALMRLGATMLGIALGVAVTVVDDH